MTYDATIKFKFNPGDKLPEGSEAGHLYTFNDQYTMSPDWYDDERARSYIRRDLKLVAGGGYDPIDANNIIDLTIVRK